MKFGQKSIFLNLHLTLMAINTTIRRISVTSIAYFIFLNPNEDNNVNILCEIHTDDSF